MFDMFSDAKAFNSDISKVGRVQRAEHVWHVLGYDSVRQRYLEVGRIKCHCHAGNDHAQRDMSWVVAVKAATTSELECVSMEQKAGASARQLCWRGGAVPPDVSRADAERTGKRESLEQQVTAMTLGVAAAVA